MTPLVEGYLYHALDGLRSLQLSENGVDFYTLTITTTKTVRDALSEWATLANAHGSLALTYAFSWSTAGVRFSATGSFHLTLDHDLKTALGFTSATHTGASDYVSNTIPAYIRSPTGITYDAPRPLEEVKSRAYRFERQTYLAHHYANETTIEIFASTGDADVLLSGGLFAGRLRAYCDTSAGSAYSITNLTGYLDVYPFAIDSVERMGVGDGHTKIRILATLEGS